MAVISNKVMVGTNDPATATYVWQNDSLISVDGEFAVGVIGNELTIDTLTTVIRSKTALTPINYGTPVWYYSNNTLSGKFYVESVERTGKEEYQINCISVIGLLDLKYHPGAVYEGKTFGAVLDSILSGTLTSADYEIDSDITSIPVYGHLPYDTARSNLHKLLMAYNVSMIKATNDASKIRFCFLGQDSATAIPDSRIYINGSVDYGKMPTKVEITEHTYIAWPEGVDEVELFDNSNSGVKAENEIVVFDEPVITSTIRGEGITMGSWQLVGESLDLEEVDVEYPQYNMTTYAYVVDEEGNVSFGDRKWQRIDQVEFGRYQYDSGKYYYIRLIGYLQGRYYIYRSRVLQMATAVWQGTFAAHNYAIVSGSGKLFGKPYTHQTKDTVYLTGVNGVENIASLTDNTLITLQNGRNVADRLIDYYGNADTQKLDIKMSGEKTGMKYTFSNAFGESKTGVLARITMHVSAFIKASCELITGLLYPGRGLLYTNVSVLTESGTWTVPTGVTKIRAVLIGGGSGGDSGYAGTAGGDADTRGGSGGTGGEGGNGGNGGRIYSVELTVTPGGTVTYNAGTAGAGGSGNAATNSANIAGGTGGNSTVRYNGTTYSSANGVPSESGFYEIINKVRYAMPSLITGTRGGNGGKGGTSKDYSYDDTTVGESGESIGTYTGGIGGTFGNFTINMPTGSASTLNHSILPQVVSASGISWYASRYHGTGGGSGAVATANGISGTGGEGTGTSSRSSSGNGDTYLFNIYAHGMNGGAGVKPGTPTSQSNYGNGGDGGHGGSGGGGGGATNTTLATASIAANNFTTCVNVDTQLDTNYTNCKGGAGGAGGDGGNGAPGCILIYYPD